MWIKRNGSLAEDPRPAMRVTYLCTLMTYIVLAQIRLKTGKNDVLPLYVFQNILQYKPFTRQHKISVRLVLLRSSATQQAIPFLRSLGLSLARVKNQWGLETRYPYWIAHWMMKGLTSVRRIMEEAKLKKLQLFTWYIVSNIATSSHICFISLAARAFTNLYQEPYYVKIEEGGSCWNLRC